MVFRRTKKDIFSFSIDRVWKKLKGWKGKSLSDVGREILIKAVAQSVPSYIMSCYKFPEGRGMENSLNELGEDTYDFYLLYFVFL